MKEERKTPISALAYRADVVVVSRQQLHLEEAKRIVNAAELVYNCPQCLVLVKDDLKDENGPRYWYGCCCFFPFYYITE